MGRSGLEPPTSPLSGIHKLIVENYFSLLYLHFRQFCNVRKTKKITQNYIPLHKYYTKYFYCRFLNNGVSYMSEIFSIFFPFRAYICLKTVQGDGNSCGS